MKSIYTKPYFRAKQATLPLFLSDFLDVRDPVLAFNQFMEGLDLEKYLSKLKPHQRGRIRHNPVDMLKTVLFGFLTKGY